MVTSILLLVTALGAGSAAGDLGPGAPPGLLSETLANGLQVTILPDSASPVVATQLWYHVGSANEEAGSRGFAHLFEHMMFGETTHHARDQYARHHHRHGGWQNAYTTFDETVYQSVIAPEHLREVLAMEADRMVHLVLSQENLDNEKKIVSEELRLRTENDPFSRVEVRTLKAVLGHHPYASPPVGTHDDVAAATLDQSRRFYDQYYRPRNAHLVVVGPVDAQATLKAVRESFGAIPAGGITPAEVPSLADWSFPEEVSLTEDLPPTEVAVLVFPLPPAGAEDHWAIEVLTRMLGGAEVDPFEEVLIGDRRRAVHAETVWLRGRRGGAVLFVAAYLPYRRRATGFRLVEETLGELSRLDWLTEESLASAKRALIRQEMRRTFFADQRADAIGRAAWWLGDEQLAFTGTAHIRELTRDEVAAAYRKLIAEASPIRLYIKPERVPLVVRLFGWIYPLLNR
ncbi:MAG: insulinase family protein [bacterium]|nr:insulinase family protein [bacterium]